jgi:hypothetical protein
MPTYAQVADDVAIALGYTADDSLRKRGQIAYNVKLVRDKLAKQILAADAQRNDPRSSSDIMITAIVPVTWNDVGDAVVTDFDAVYFDLPFPVIGSMYDSGINFIRYLRNEIPMECPPAVSLTPFTGTTLASLNAIYGSAYQRPSAKQPYYARAKAGNKDRVYLFGIRDKVKHLLIGIYAGSDFLTMSLDDDINLPDDKLHTLKKMVMEMEAWSLQIPQERLMNDGRDMQPEQIVRTSPIMSVNHPSQADA